MLLRGFSAAPRYPVPAECKENPRLCGYTGETGSSGILTCFQKPIFIYPSDVVMC